MIVNERPSEDTRQGLSAADKGSSMQERRHPRATLEIVARFRQSPGGTQFEGVGCNLSAAGMFIGTSRPLPAGTKLDIECESDELDGQIYGSAEVTWTRTETEGANRPSGMGVRFVSLVPSARRLIGELLKRGNMGTAGSRSRSNPPTGASLPMPVRLVVVESRPRAFDPSIDAVIADPLDSDETDAETESSVTGAKTPLQVLLSQSPPPAASSASSDESSFDEAVWRAQRLAELVESHRPAPLVSPSEVRVVGRRRRWHIGPKQKSAQVIAAVCIVALAFIATVAGIGAGPGKGVVPAKVGSDERKPTVAPKRTANSQTGTADKSAQTRKQATSGATLAPTTTVSAETSLAPLPTVRFDPEVAQDAKVEAPFANSVVTEAQSQPSEPTADKHVAPGTGPEAVSKPAQPPASQEAHLESTARILDQAHAALDAGDPQQARDLALDAIERRPEQAGGYIVLAGALDALGDKEGKKAAFQRCVEHATDSLVAACKALAR